MKKSLLLFFGASTLFSAGVLAQPIITSAGFNPVMGDVKNQTTVGYVNPGSPGTNQTWDLSTMTGTTTSTSTVVTVASTPYAATFPSATSSIKGNNGSYTYVKTSTAAYQLNGIVVPSGTTNITFNYSNLEDLMHFPFNYNNMYTDTWAATFTSAGSNYFRKGADSTTYDGYGTLILPSGTYNNVSRVHFVQNYQDSTYIAGFGPYVIIYRNDEYFWYLTGNHSAIANVFILTNSVSAPTQSGSYLNNIAVGIDEEDVIANSYKLFPNPVVNTVNINISLNENQKVDVKLFNAIGANVSSAINVDGIQGENNYKLNVADLPDGIYFAQISLDGTLSSTRRFVISR